MGIHMNRGNDNANEAVGEIDIDKMDRPRGMDITVVTTATNNDEGRALLRELGFPFKTAQHKD